MNRKRDLKKQLDQSKKQLDRARESAKVDRSEIDDLRNRLTRAVLAQLKAEKEAEEAQALAARRADALGEIYQIADEIADKAAAGVSNQNVLDDPLLAKLENFQPRSYSTDSGWTTPTTSDEPRPSEGKKKIGLLANEARRWSPAPTGQCEYAETDWCCSLPAGHAGGHDSGRETPKGDFPNDYRDKTYEITLRDGFKFRLTHDVEGTFNLPGVLIGKEGITKVARVDTADQKQ